MPVKCPVCADEIVQDSVVIVCNQCETFMHSECIEDANYKCAITGCGCKCFSFDKFEALPCVSIVNFSDVNLPKDDALESQSENPSILKFENLLRSYMDHVEEKRNLPRLDRVIRTLKFQEKFCDSAVYSSLEDLDPLLSACEERLDKALKNELFKKFPITYDDRIAIPYIIIMFFIVFFSGSMLMLFIGLLGFSIIPDKDADMREYILEKSRKNPLKNFDTPAIRTIVEDRNLIMSRYILLSAK